MRGVVFKECGLVAPIGLTLVSASPCKSSLRLQHHSEQAPEEIFAGVAFDTGKFLAIFDENEGGGEDDGAREGGAFGWGVGDVDDLERRVGTFGGVGILFGSDVFLPPDAVGAALTLDHQKLGGLSESGQECEERSKEQPFGHDTPD